MTRKMLKVGIMAFAAMSWMSLPSHAHHSGAAYDRSKTMSIEGEVTNWRFVNPHCWLQIRATDENGQEILWDFEGLPAGMLAPRGYRRNSFELNDRVTVFYRPMQDGSPGGGNLQGAILADGSTLDRVSTE